MAMFMRVNGAWTSLLSDWLDRERMAAPHLRARLAAYTPDDIVPITAWRELLEQTALLRPDVSNLGLQIGSGVEPRHVGVLGYLVLACDHLAEAMLAYQRYERLFYGLDLAQVSVDPELVEIRWEPSDQGSIAEQLSMTALVMFLRRHLDQPPPLTRLGFCHAPTDANAAECEAFFGCPVTFADTHTRLVFPAACLGMNMPHREPSLRQLLDRQATALLDALPAPHAYERAVQQLLVRMLPDGEISAQRLATAMHQSTRTLQRRLAERGLSWQSLLDRTREQLARQYLADQSLSMSEIALLLGYSEQSNFTRAFKRWTGQTPLVFRKA